MERRRFIKIAGLSAAALAAPPLAWAARNNRKGAPHALPVSQTSWRSVELTTKIMLMGEGPGKVWLPFPLTKTSYQEHTDTLWRGNFSRAGILKDSTYGASVFYGEWDNAGPVEMETTFRLRMRDRTGVEQASAHDARIYLKPSPHVPTDGLEKITALKIVGKQTDSDRKAREIYEWMAEHTARDKNVVGCGPGDVKAMFESGRLQGKCADLSSLFVGLCRASGVPAREVFGLRVFPSRLAKSLGKAGDVSGAQHCRAEYFSENQGGWVPVDPADVRKAILEENLTLQDAKAKEIRQKLFGFWEMNWLAYNSARDFTLPPAPGVAVNYMMYPLYLAANRRDDGTSPKDFRYAITATAG